MSGQYLKKACGLRSPFWMSPWTASLCGVTYETSWFLLHVTGSTCGRTENGMATSQNPNTNFSWDHMGPSACFCGHAEVIISVKGTTISQSYRCPFSHSPGLKRIQSERRVIKQAVRAVWSLEPLLAPCGIHYIPSLSVSQHKANHLDGISVYKMCLKPLLPNPQVYTFEPCCIYSSLLGRKAGYKSCK